MKTEKKLPERSRSVLGRFYCIEQITSALLLDVRELWEQFRAGFVRSVSIGGSSLCKILPWFVLLYVDSKDVWSRFLFVCNSQIRV